jgi:hypothetical protein
MTDWKRTVRDAYRDYGATAFDRTRHTTRYRFPDGAMYVIPHTVDERWAKRQLALLQNRYGQAGPAHRSRYERRGGAPRVDLERLTASEHAKQRLHEMRQQAASVRASVRVSCDMRDVLYAIKLGTPYWSPDHETWLWEYGDLAVAVAETDIGFTITTVMWARPELFAVMPRPEKKGA